MAIPYQTSIFKSANAFVIAIWGPTTKFNSCQYFRLYGMCANLNMHDRMRNMTKKYCESTASASK